MIIQDIISLVRGLVSDVDDAKFRSDASSKLASANASMMRQVITEQINEMMQKMTTKSWTEDFDETEKKYTIGLLTVIGGWCPSLRTGQLIQVNIGSSWCYATVVDEGIGKDKMSVILEEDDNLTIVKINRTQARAVQRSQIDLNGNFGQNIDCKSLHSAIVKVFKETEDYQEAAELNAMLGQQSSSPVVAADRGVFYDNLHSPIFLLKLLLKFSAQLTLSAADLQDASIKEFFKTLVSISERSAREEMAEGKNAMELEVEFARSWENLFDNSMASNRTIYSPKEYPRAPNAEEEELKKLEELNRTELMRKASSIAHEAKFVDGEYVQTLNSYLVGLPEPDQSGAQQFMLLKQLQHWEDHLIPKMVGQMIRDRIYPFPSPFFDSAVEQVRYYLRIDDIATAMREATILFDRIAPQITYPDPEYDWSANTLDETFVDSWALARIQNELSRDEQKLLKEAEAKSSSSLQRTKDLDPLF